MAVIWNKVNYLDESPVKTNMLVAKELKLCTSVSLPVPLTSPPWLLLALLSPLALSSILCILLYIEVLQNCCCSASLLLNSSPQPFGLWTYNHVGLFDIWMFPFPWDPISFPKSHLTPSAEPQSSFLTSLSQSCSLKHESFDWFSCVFWIFVLCFL